ATCSYSRTSVGTVDDRQMPSTVAGSGKSARSAPSSSPVRCASVAMRQRSPSSGPSNSPKTVCVFPTSTARSMAGRRLQVVVAAQRLADPLGERLGGERRLVALAAQLLDRHVAGREDLGARDDPRRPVLVPDPDVLEVELEERQPAGRRRRRLLDVELVAEIGRVLGQHAVPEQPEDRLVLLLQRELELCLVLV